MNQAIFTPMSDLTLWEKTPIKLIEIGTPKQGIYGIYFEAQVEFQGRQESWNLAENQLAKMRLAGIRDGDDFLMERQKRDDKTYYFYSKP